MKLLQVGGHHSNEEFSVRGKEPKDEVQIYTWKDATLRELTDLVHISFSTCTCKFNDFVPKIILSVPSNVYIAGKRFGTHIKAPI